MSYEIKNGKTEPEIKVSKSIKEIVEAKGGDVLLSEDNKTLIVKSTMSFSNEGKKTIEDYQPTDKELDLINSKYSNVDLSRRGCIGLHTTFC